jgi:hypothetical protein
MVRTVKARAVAMERVTGTGVRVATRGAADQSSPTPAVPGAVGGQQQVRDAM